MSNRKNTQFLHGDDLAFKVLYNWEEALDNYCINCEQGYLNFDSSNFAVSFNPSSTINRLVGYWSGIWLDKKEDVSIIRTHEAGESIYIILDFLNKVTSNQIENRGYIYTLHDDRRMGLDNLLKYGVNTSTSTIPGLDTNLIFLPLTSKEYNRDKKRYSCSTCGSTSFYQARVDNTESPHFIPDTHMALICNDCNTVKLTPYKMK